jgi:hypothetical protein
MSTINRRSFLKVTGVAAGTAAIASSPALAAAVEPGSVETVPSGPIMQEPIIAVIRDPNRFEITVLSGTTEKTYIDRPLVTRLVKAAGHNHTARRQEVA